MAYVFKTLPLDNQPSRSVVTEFAKKQIKLRTYYNQFDGGWFLDIRDGLNNPIVLGLAIVPGVDIIFPFPDIDLGNLAYIVEGGEGQGFSDLGSTGKVVSRYDA